jgi:hypothetical protein
MGEGAKLSRTGAATAEPAPHETELALPQRRASEEWLGPGRFAPQGRERAAAAAQIDRTMTVWRKASGDGALSARATEGGGEKVFLSRKGGGKNAQHANQDKKNAAQEKYEAAKAELEELQRKPNKTKEDKEKLAELRRTVKHLKKQADFSGENHSQTAKGSH